MEFPKTWQEEEEVMSPQIALYIGIAIGMVITWGIAGVVIAELIIQHKREKKDK